jgi:hypothetical protein
MQLLPAQPTTKGPAEMFIGDTVFCRPIGFCRAAETRRNLRKPQRPTPTTATWT